ncbi:hypothetical protein Emag_006952 [Eimeria magna]
MTQAKAVEFLRDKCGEVRGLCVLGGHRGGPSNAARDHMRIAERRHFKAEVDRKDEVIRRLPQQQPPAQQQASSRLQSSRGLARELKTRPHGEALRTPRVTIGPCNPSGVDSSSGPADGTSRAASSARSTRSLLEKRQTVPPATAPTTPRRSCNPTPMLPSGVQAASLKKKSGLKSVTAEATSQRGTVKSNVRLTSLSPASRQQTRKETGASREMLDSPQRPRGKWFYAVAAALGCLLPVLVVPVYLWLPHDLAA